MIRAKQLSSTVGTASYTLGTTPAGYMPIADSTAMQPYIAVDTATKDWEAGLGICTAGVLARTKVLQRNDGLTSAVNWPAGEREILITPLPDTLFSPAMRHAAANEGGTQPGPGTNKAQGYDIGSTFTDTGTGRLFLLVGFEAGGNARWRHINAVQGRKGSDDDWNGESFNAFAETDAGGLFQFGEGYPDGVLGGVAARASRTRRMNFALYAAPASGSQTIELYGLDNQVSVIDGHILVADGSDNIKIFEIHALARNPTVGTPVFLGTPTVTTLYEDAALATCALTLTAGFVAIQGAFTGIPAAAKLSVGLTVTDLSLSAQLP